jgi:hypothetical protein
MAAARALASRGRLDLDRIAHDVGFRVKGYAAVDLSLSEGATAVLEDPCVGALLARSGADGDAVRLGMLAAIADAPPSPRLSSLLLYLLDEGIDSPERTELLARAVAKQAEPRAIPRLVDRLSLREGREAVRVALVTLGEPALDEVWRTLRDSRRPRALRIHIPKTLARFGSKAAADRLLQSIEEETDGLVRYKSIRALGVLVATSHVRVDRDRVLRLATDNLLRHFWLLGARIAIASGPPSPAAARRCTGERLLVGLIDDKLRQSVDRAFRLLEIAYPHEDIHRVRVVSFSNDPYARANAGEFLDTLLRRRHQRAVRTLLRLVTDDLPIDERLRRGLPLLPTRPPMTRDEALAALVRDPDSTLSGLAAQCARGSLAAPNVSGHAALEVAHA